MLEPAVEDEIANEEPENEDVENIQDLRFFRANVGNGPGPGKYHKKVILIVLIPG